MADYSQVIVIVTIVGVDDEAQVFYTYTDDENNKVRLENVHSRVCAVPPYYTLYILDYASSRNGWQFKKKLKKLCGPRPEHWRTWNKLGMLTYHEKGVDRFGLKFYNTRTQRSKKDDPQEANVKQPT